MYYWLCPKIMDWMLVNRKSLKIIEGQKHSKNLWFPYLIHIMVWFHCLWMSMDFGNTFYQSEYKGPGQLAKLLWVELWKQIESHCGEKTIGKLLAFIVNILASLHYSNKKIFLTLALPFSNLIMVIFSPQQSLPLKLLLDKICICCLSLIFYFLFLFFLSGRYGGLFDQQEYMKIWPKME